MALYNERLVSIDPAYAHELAALDSGRHSSNLVPMVLRRTVNGERAMDIFSRQLEDRVIVLNGPIDDSMASLINLQLHYLESLAHDKDIFVEIQSPGGYCTAGLSIYDTMRSISCHIVTICSGIAASMAAFLLTAGGDKRLILPNAEVMIHQPLGGASGQATDILISAKSIELTKRRLTSIIAQSCHKPYEQVRADMERNYYMTAQEAIDYGLVDGFCEMRKSIIMPDPELMALPITL